MVIIKEVTPDPLPMCLSPLTHQRPSRSRTAVARVAMTSPPPPGSDEMVPNHSPAFAADRTRWRCSRQASGSAGDSSGSSSHIASTVGCIVATSATDGSARAKVRNIAPTKRVDRCAPCHTPPISAGTPVNVRPASCNVAKSAGSSARRPSLPKSADHRSATAFTFFPTEAMSIFMSPKPRASCVATQRQSMRLVLLCGSVWHDRAGR